MKYEFYLHHSTHIPVWTWDTADMLDRSASTMTLRDSALFLTKRNPVRGNIVSLSYHLLPSVQLYLPISKTKHFLALESEVEVVGKPDAIKLKELFHDKIEVGLIPFDNGWFKFEHENPLNFIRIEVEADTQEDFIELPIFEIKLRAKRL